MKRKQEDKEDNSKRKKKLKVDDSLKYEIDYLPNKTQFRTRMESQYWGLKKQAVETVPNCILCMQNGTFFEFYENDAAVAIQRLGLMEMNKKEGSMRQCGVNEKVYLDCVKQLLGYGYNVAIAEQTTTGKSSSGTKELVKREITKIYTAATLDDSDWIMNYDSPILLALKEEDGEYGVAYTDISVGDACLMRVKSEVELETLLIVMNPKEILYQRGNLSKQTLHLIRNKANISKGLIAREPGFQFIDSQSAMGYVEEYFGTTMPDQLQTFHSDELVMSSFGTIIEYLKGLKRADDVIPFLNFKDNSGRLARMGIDGQTIRNLEILSNNRDGTTHGSLIEKISNCFTPMGKRMLRSWLCQPLQNINDIEARYNAIEDLSNLSSRNEIISLLSKLPDLARLLTKVHTESSRKKRIRYQDDDQRKIPIILKFIEGMKGSLAIASILNESVDEFKSTLLQQIATKSSIEDFRSRNFPDLTDLLERITNSFEHSMTGKKHQMSPKQGLDPEYDELKSNISSINSELDEYLVGIKKKLKCNVKYIHLKALKYQLEVPIHTKVPSSFKQVSKTSKVTRYHTDEIETMVQKLTKYETKAQKRYQQTVEKVFDLLESYHHVWKRVNSIIAELDCLISLTITSTSSAEWSRPVLIDSETPYFSIEEMTHPFISTRDDIQQVIPNNTAINGRSPVIIVTGPNMGGKSTLLRQNCIAIILAQIGCFVPARKFEFSPVDKIFSRIGANDKIMSGESTFMVELNETANILQNATRHSFVILDEIGRGTSTYDGMSIAFSIVQWIAERISCRTLFSTHFYWLTQQLKYHPLIHFYRMEHQVEDDRLIFTYRFVPGVCSTSYGLECAKIAGIPEQVIVKARQASERIQSLVLDGHSSTDSKQETSSQVANCFTSLVDLLSQDTGKNLREVLKNAQSAALECLTTFSAQSGMEVQAASE